MKPTIDAHAWWSRLRHQGLLLSPAVMVDRFNQPDKIRWNDIDYLRQAYTRFQAAIHSGPKDSLAITEKAVLQFADALFEGFLGYFAANVRKQGQFPESMTAVFQVGSRREAVRPHRAVEVGESRLLIMVDTNPHVGRGRGRTSYARLLELLRGTGNRLGLLINGLQVRLVYAGLDTESWCEWEVERWFDQGEGEQELAGLKQLLSSGTLNPPRSDDPKKTRPLSLLEAVEESRKRQADLSSVLGESVRRAVEHLTDALSIEARRKTDLLECIYTAPAGSRLTDAEVHDALLQATVRIVMRAVVCLFAESRGLFPISDALYTESYSIKSLFETLDEERQREGENRLVEYKYAWPRLVALFRLVHEGSRHANFTATRYGGLLFRPGNASDSDPVLRALYVLEREVPISDHTVYSILRRLLRGKLPVIVGRTRREVEGPVDYTALRTEFIGIIYEGLLDYKLKRATDNAQVFLNIGREPVLPLERLEGMLTADPKGLKDLLTKLGKEKATGKSSSESEEVEEEEEAEEVEPEPAPLFEAESDSTVEAQPVAPETDETPVFSAEHLDADQRARAWAKKAVEVAGLAPKKRRNESDYAFDKRVEEVANTLIRRVVGDGEFFLVRAGNVRKGSGTFYTKPQLAVPTVHRTLEPLCYKADKTPKTPEEILSLKVCDPACGSASFLVAALHYLTEALYKSLVHHCNLEDAVAAAKLTLPFGKPREGADGEELVPFPPDDEQRGHLFAKRVKALLRRHVVERCIYGVDINPLAVEFARVSLWVETMDEKLPFGFLDHKIKVGNALVGCWLDRVLDYPIKAWEREGGDGKDGERTSRIETFLKGSFEGKRRTGDGIIKKEMRSLIDTNFRETIPLFPAEKLEPIDVVAEARAEYDRLHSLSAWEVEAREAEYNALQKNPHVQRLKRAMDEWCAVWFWPMDAESAKHVPTPKTFHQTPPNPPVNGGEQKRDEIITRLAHDLRFFHWELEFPDVFTPTRSGYDAMLGNPPWEVMKPNSHEFFSNYDPLYRTYDKQEALRQQNELFKELPECAERWLDYSAQFKAMSNWVSGVCAFFDVALAKGAASKGYQELWLDRIRKRIGFAGQPHPFCYQGSADLNSYKMFLEIAHTLLGKSGRLGLIVPSGLYTDSGTQELRELFLDKCTWDWLFSFENRKKIFDIHSSFKFAAVIVQKSPPNPPVNGGEQKLKAAFMVHDVTEWEQSEPPVFEFDRSLIPLFSPRSKSLPEVRTARDLEISRKIYDHSFRIGDNKPGWEIKYATEFHMTNDSKLFPPREKWEAQGYKPDVFGRWIGPKGDVALPLYEGRMIGQFDPMQKGWVSGKGRSAEWREIPFDSKALEPQYLISKDTYISSDNRCRGFKFALMSTGSGTNTRTAIGSAIGPVPCGNSASVLLVNEGDFWSCLKFAGVVSSMLFDVTFRAKLGGINVNWFIVEEGLLPHSALHHETIIALLSRLTFIHRRFAPEWLKLKQELPELEQKEWKQWWAVTEADRLRLRVEIDALCADLYGLDPDDFDWIVRDDPSDPKGFWRVDKQLPYAERLTGLAANAFRKLKEGKWSADSAAELSNDEFFEMLGIPELTNEQAAKAKGLNQPLIMKRTGCHSWRPELFAEDDPRHGWTWDHCKQDAIALLGSEKELDKYLKDEPATAPVAATTVDADGTRRDLLGNPIPTNLFGEEEFGRRRKK
ncbi:hypothetical protein KJZ99_08100 [bacterium]|nr:hypothetical protein [bacterium]